MKSFVLETDRLIYSMSKHHAPSMHVPDGCTVTIHTCDCFEDQIRQESDFAGVDWDHINPATGPIFIEGAEPGDLLAVYIRNIELAANGVMTTGPKMGVLGDELTQNIVKMIPISDGKAIFSDTLQLPLRPMIGVIGTAPAGEDVPCGTPGDHGGNMDCRRITEGAWLILPVNVPGALFALGDLHASMGDGEVAVCGIEVAGQVTVEFRVVKNKSWRAPIVINDDTVMTIAAAQTLDGASVRAVKNMVRFLEEECGMSNGEAILLLSAAGDLRVCQVVDPLITARMELPRWIAEKQGFTVPFQRVEHTG